MAKCRNCKKEIDATATRCPYCLTEMPTSDFLSKFKSIFIGITVLAFAAFAIYYSIFSIIRNFDSASFSYFLLFVILSILFFLGIVAVVFAIALFANAKKWAEEDENKVTSVGTYILFGIVCTVISLGLIAIAVVLIFK